MRCYICDIQLDPDEVREDKHTGEFMPCAKCTRESNNSLNEMEERDNE